MFGFGKRGNKIKCYRLSDVKHIASTIKSGEEIMILEDTGQSSDTVFENDCRDVCYSCQMNLISGVLHIGGNKYIRVKKSWG